MPHTYCVGGGQIHLIAHIYRLGGFNILCCMPSMALKTMHPSTILMHFHTFMALKLLFKSLGFVSHKACIKAKKDVIYI